MGTSSAVSLGIHSLSHSIFTAEISFTTFDLSVFGKAVCFLDLIDELPENEFSVSNNGLSNRVVFPNINLIDR